MPTATSTICKEPGCSRRTTSRYCEQHAGKKNLRAILDKARANDPHRSLYHTKRWKDVRAAVLRREPLCRECAKDWRPKLATQVDHVVNARQWIAQHSGDENAFFDETNLQPLCGYCHNRKTAIEVGWAGRH